MKVLTYLKDLPVKLTNSNKHYIDLEGATLYIDEESNRYAYVCFVNKTKKPFFALILNLTQYDVGGHLIKKEKYYVPHCYGPKGKVVLEKPLNLDSDCEALEVEITLAVFARRVFANDQIRSRNSVRFEFPRLSNKDPLLPSGNAAQFNWPESSNEPVEEVKQPEIVEETPVEESIPVVEEKPVIEKAPVKEANEDKKAPKEEPVKEEEAPEVEEEKPAEEPVIEEAAPVLGEFVDANPDKKDILTRIILPAVVATIAIAAVLFVFFFVKGFVPSSPYRG